jgi:signal transduction histidine kinase
MSVTGGGLSAALAGTVLSLAIVGVLLYATARSVDDVSRQQYPTLAKWAVGGFLGAGVVGALVLGLQPVNDRVELAVVVFQLALWGAVGGALAGVRIAQGATARANSEREWDRWRSLFRNAPAAIADLAIEDGTLVIVTANDAFREWFSVAETDEKQAFRSVVAADTDDVDLVSAVENGRTVVTTFSLSTAGERRYYRLRLSPYSYGDVEQRAHVMLTDGTDLKEMEQELQRTVAELSDKNDRLERFASVVSHDLRNPLNVAAGHLELVDAPDDEERLQKVAAALDRIDDLVNDLLDLAREGRTIDDPDPLDFRAVVQACWETVDTGQIDLVLDLDATILADEDRLMQLFENLFRNAREHAGDDVTVTVGELDDANGFFVADDGPGVPEDQREDVFEPGTTSMSGGTGLGLNIVREIARGHGWTVELTESADSGARFEFAGVERGNRTGRPRSSGRSDG